MTPRLLLCRPQGGLNDMLNQIERCCRYAEQTGRRVIVDTHYAHATHFNDNFSRYFASRQKRLLLSLDAQEVEALPVFPRFLQGRINTYTTHFNARIPAICDTATGSPITIDFRQDYPQPLLVHHQAGGGTISAMALPRLSLQAPLVDELIGRIRRIGGPWVGVHIRHTDYSTDYEPLLQQLRRDVPARLFLATDNQQVKAHFLSELTQTRVYSFTDLLSTDGSPLHCKDGIDPHTAFARNRDAILDLLLLALSKQLLFSRLLPNPWGASYSGFSRLAHQLWQSKIILKHLLADPRIDFGLG